MLQTIWSAILSAIFFLQAALGLPVMSINFKFDTQAAVFESGDGMYTVMWSTTRPGTGYVTYNYEGTDYTVYDAVGGNICTLDTVHAVRVPKKHLDNNDYTYHSQLVNKKLDYSAVKGKTIDSEPVHFRGYNGEDEVNALVLSDIHGSPEVAQKAAAYMKAEPSFVIMNGDITSQVITKKDFLNIVKYAFLFSKGEIPVAYARGNHEPRGEFAPEMIKYFRTSADGLYYTFQYGPVWSVVLDSGEDKDDSHAEYSGLVDFKSYLTQEAEWLKNIEPSDAAYRLCIVHKPLMDDTNGNQFLPILAEKGIDAAVSGHLHRFDLHFYDGSYPFQRMVTGGRSSDDGFVATMLTFANGNIHAVAFNEKGEQIADENFPLL